MSGKAQEGFTLIEVLIAFGVFTVLLLGFASVMQITSGNYVNIKSNTKLHQEVESALDFMAREIRTATSFSLDNSNSTTLTFTILKDSATTQIVYSLSNNALTRAEGEGTAQPLAQGVNTWSITYNSTTQAYQFDQINLTLGITSSDKSSLTYQSSIAISPRALKRIVVDNWVQ